MTHFISSSRSISRRHVLTAALVGGVLSAYAPHAAAASSSAVPSTRVSELRLPAPTGRFTVGVRTRFLEDPSRWEATGQPRALPIKIWYPAFDGSGGRAAPYLSPVIQAAFEGWLKAAPHTFDVDMHAFVDARPRPNPRGVLLLSGGYQLPVNFYSALATELSSHGFVVLGFDHPHETMAVEQPDGSVIQSTLTSDQGFPERMLDVGAVLQNLAELVPQWKRGVPVGMFGHSLGGATALEAARIYSVLDAAVDLDGTPRGGVVNRGLSKPFGIQLSTIRIVDHLKDANLEAFLAHSKGQRRVQQLHDIYHTGFSDFVSFNPQVLARDPLLYAALEKDLRTDVKSVAVGDAAIATQRRFVLDFFERFLNGK